MSRLILALAAFGLAGLLQSPPRRPTHCGCGAQNCTVPCSTCCYPRKCDCTLPDPSKR